MKAVDALATPVTVTLTDWRIENPVFSVRENKKTESEENAPAAQDDSEIEEWEEEEDHREPGREEQEE